MEIPTHTHQGILILGAGKMEDRHKVHYEAILKVLVVFFGSIIN